MQNRALVSLVTVGAVLAGTACNFTSTDTTDASASGTATDGGTTAGTDGGGSTAGPTSDPTTTTTPTTTSPTTDPTATTTDGTSAGSSGGGSTTGVDLDDATIYQIQGGEIPEGSIVTLKGVIVTSPTQEDKGIMWIQEPDGGEYSGIAVYMFADVVMGFAAKPGLVVDIKGEYTEFFGESQLKVTALADVTIVGEGEPPAPEVVAAADIATNGAKAEAYEGVLVQVENVKVTNPAADIGEFEVEGALRIGDFFLFPQMMSPKVAMDQLFTSIAGPLQFSYENFKVIPRTVADLVTDAMPPAGNTIYEIQQGMVPVKSAVKVKGAIVTSPLTFKKDGFFIQDPMGGEWSGIYVYVGANAVAVKPGDIVDVDGTYDEYFEFSQIAIAAPANVVVTGTAPVPAPAVVAAADVTAGGIKQENYEGVLVTVQAVQVAAVNPMFGEYELTDGLFVDDLFFAKADWKMPMVGDKFMSLTGPLSFSFMESRLNPRTAADIVP